MENATKALLIAAAVLIAIVLIALGVNLLNSAGDASGDAKNVANAIQGSSQNAAGSVTSTLNKLDVTF